MAFAITPQEHKQIVLLTYRHLLRAINTAFRDDTRVRISAIAKAQIEFREPVRPKPLADGREQKSWTKKNPDMIGTSQVAQRIEHAQSVTQILRENVVQGRREGEDGEKYKLRFTEHTQRMDNEDAGRLKGTTKSFKEIKDARF